MIDRQGSVVDASQPCDATADIPHKPQETFCCGALLLAFLVLHERFEGSGFIWSSQEAVADFLERACHGESGRTG
jgi:hypothetical protein